VTVGLRRLDIGDTGVSDLGPLSAMTGLEEFRCSDAVEDLGPLSTLVGLRRLDIGRTGVSDFGPLSTLVGLGGLKSFFDQFFTF
jgi:internalin A